MVRARDALDGWHGDSHFGTPKAAEVTQLHPDSLSPTTFLAPRASVDTLAGCPEEDP
jgi:hypothetical protein